MTRMTDAVIPVRSFRLGKQRLASVLTDHQRHRIGRALAERVTTVAQQAGLTPVVVTADPDVIAWAKSDGIEAMPDRGGGLNGAASTGTARAITSNAPWVVLHSDLPLLQVSDLSPLVEAVEHGRSVIAPSCDGGTSALASSRPVKFAYGPGSFHHHLGRIEDPLILARAGLLHDLDSPLDLESARRQVRGQWLEGIY